MFKLFLSLLFVVLLLILPSALVSQSNFSLTLDLDSSAGDQAVTTLNVTSSQEVLIQVYGSNIKNAVGISLLLEYDVSQVSYQGFDIGDIYHFSGQVLTDYASNPTSVQVGIASLGDSISVNSGLLGTIRFRTRSTFSGTLIQITRYELFKSNQVYAEDVSNISVELLSGNVTSSSDFNGDSQVDFSDFWLFASRFGSIKGDAYYESVYDLDNDSAIGISDFILFSNDFGKKVSPSNNTIVGSMPDIYWTDIGTRKIQKLNSEGNNVEDIVSSGIKNPAGISFDTMRGKIYWIDSNIDKIQRSNLDGSSVEDIITSGLVAPTDISLDLNGDKIYWADKGTDKIQRANLDGSGVENLVTTGLKNPLGIVLDIASNKIYWTDQGTDKIQRANLDGSSVEDLITTGLSSPQGIALDPLNNKVYWTDWGSNKIQRANLDGSNVEDLVVGLGDPRDVALDIATNKMYWTDSGTDKVQRSNLDGSNVEDLVTSGLTNPSGIALYFFHFDLVVDSLVVSDSTPNTGQTFTLSASLRNQGTDSSIESTLNYYVSIDDSISSDDKRVGLESIGTITAFGSSNYSIDLVASDTSTVYYYYACVDSVNEESDSSNNCSSTVKVEFNSVPKLDKELIDQTARLGELFNYTFPLDTFSDADGDSLVYTSSGRPDWLSFNDTTRTFSGTPADTTGSPFNVLVSADDNKGGIAESSFILTVKFPLLLIEIDPREQEINLGDSISNVVVSVSGGNPPYDTFNLSNLPSGVTSDTSTVPNPPPSPNPPIREPGQPGIPWTFNSFGTTSDTTTVPNKLICTISGTPTNTGTYSVKIVVEDEGESATDSLSIIVNPPLNNPPKFGEGSITLSVNENSTSNQVVGSPVVATDPDGDSITYTLSGTDANKFVIVSSTGQVLTASNVTYDYESVNDYTVTVNANDGNGGITGKDVSISLLDVDEPPKTIPTNILVTPTGGRVIIVSWNKVSDEQGKPPVTGYRLEYKNGSNGSWNRLSTITGTSRTIIVPTVGVGEDYYVRLSTLNDEGSSNWSSDVSVSSTAATNISIKAATESEYNNRDSYTILSNRNLAGPVTWWKVSWQNPSYVGSQEIDATVTENSGVSDILRGYESIVITDNEFLLALDHIKTLGYSVKNVNISIKSLDRVGSDNFVQLTSTNSGLLKDYVITATPPESTTLIIAEYNRMRRRFVSSIPDDQRYDEWELHVQQRNPSVNSTYPYQGYVTFTRSSDNSTFHHNSQDFGDHNLFKITEVRYNGVDIPGSAIRIEGSYSDTGGKNNEMRVRYRRKVFDSDWSEYSPWKTFTHNN